MSLNIFIHNNLSTFRYNADVFKDIEAGDKLRWQSDGNGGFVPKIDKAGISQGLKRTWAYYIKNDDESQGIEASKKAIEFAESFWIIYNIHENDFKIRYQAIVLEDRARKAEDPFSFEAIGRAFVTLSETYFTVNSGWRKDSDEEVSTNYKKAATILADVVDKANKYNDELSKGSPPRAGLFEQYPKQILTDSLNGHVADTQFPMGL